MFKEKNLYKIVGYSFLFTIIILIFKIFIVPASQYKARTYIQDSNIDFFPSLIRANKFIDTVEDLTIYIDKKIDNSKYQSIFLKDVNVNGSMRIIYAKMGELVNNENERSLRLFDGKIINLNEKKLQSLILKNKI